MKIEKVGLEDTGSFASIFLDYIQGKPELTDFFELAPQVESFGEQLKKKEFPESHRQILFDSLQEQYASNQQTATLRANLESLKDPKTFTVVTGHQLNIFSGPLYFIYKIVTTIRLCQQLKSTYPEYNFVPIYWMATEDHDFEEICHFHLFNQTYRWETDQTGGVGRFDPTGLERVLEKIPEKLPLFEEAYLHHPTLASATRYFVNELFGEDGLVVIDSDNARLKSLFGHIIKDDILNHRANDMVESTSSQLASLGYKTQVHPRSINFFYLTDGLRERLYRENGHYKVRNTDLSFTQEEILKILDSNPERFSPNVIMRPLYQETILPNLAYVGGPAEIAYWLQLKRTFDHYQVSFPILIPRNFCLIINKGINKKIEKLNLSYQDLFLATRELQALYSRENSENPVDLTAQRDQLKTLFENIKQVANRIDQSLTGLVGAEQAKAEKGLENLEKRIKKSEEQLHSTAFTQIESIKSRLFPEGHLQERHDNFLNFYLNNPQFLQEVKDSLDPFDYRFHLVIQD